MASIPAKFKTKCTNPQCYIKLTASNIYIMAQRLYHYLCVRGLESDVNIYFKQKDKWHCISDCKSSNKPCEELTYDKNGANDKYYLTRNIEESIRV